MNTTVTSTITWPWVITIILGCALVAVLVTIIIGRKSNAARKLEHSDDEIWVANSQYIRSLPTFKRQVRRYRLLQVTGVGFLTLALVSTAFLAAKPAQVKVTDPRMANRDIVLCLDVSASMLEYDRELVNVFSALVDNFAGERIALSIFNTTSRAVFPLTDDYGMVKEQLNLAYEALNPRAVSGSSEALEKYEYFTAGANANLDVGASLIGDGLANCALMFEGSTHPALVDAEGKDAQSTGEGSEEAKPKDADATDSADGAAPEESSTENQSAKDRTTEPRSRSIIFATDNDLEGTPIYSLGDAAALATKLDVSLIGLYGSGSTDLAGEEEFQEVFTKAGGMYFYSDDPTMVDTIVADIQSRQAVIHDAAPIITTTNVAGPWLLLLIVGLLGFLIVQWRLSE